jgi:hypothetical protein
MLQKMNDRVRECYRLAAQARVQAMQATDPKIKARFFEVEERYIRLAHSHELNESVAMLTQEVRRFLGDQQPERTASR